MARVSLARTLIEILCHLLYPKVFILFYARILAHGASLLASCWMINPFVWATLEGKFAQKTGGSWLGKIQIRSPTDWGPFQMSSQWAEGVQCCSVCSLRREPPNRVKQRRPSHWQAHRLADIRLHSFVCCPLIFIPRSNLCKGTSLNADKFPPP